MRILNSKSLALFMAAIAAIICCWGIFVNTTNQFVLCSSGDLRLFVLPEHSLASDRAGSTLVGLSGRLACNSENWRKPVPGWMVPLLLRFLPKERFLGAFWAPVMMVGTESGGGFLARNLFLWPGSRSIPKEEGISPLSSEFSFPLEADFSPETGVFYLPPVPHVPESHSEARAPNGHSFEMLVPSIDSRGDWIVTCELGKREPVCVYRQAKINSRFELARQKVHQLCAPESAASRDPKSFWPCAQAWRMAIFANCDHLPKELVGQTMTGILNDPLPISPAWWGRIRYCLSGVSGFEQFLASEQRRQVLNPANGL